MYKRFILYELKNNETISKVIINKNTVQCDIDLIKNDITLKIKDIVIDYVEFYCSLCDYGIIEETIDYSNLKKLPLLLYPIYKKDTNFNDFLEFYLKNYNNNEIEIFETFKFIKRKYHFEDKDECLKSIVYEKTNNKYEKFVQLFYHVGDYDDMERYGYIYIRTMYENIIKYENNNILINNIFEINFESIKNTFFYLFNKMKKGVLIAIKDNKLLLYLPFSKHNYENDFYEELYFDENDKKILQEYKRTKNNNLLEKLKKNTIYYSNKYHLKNLHPDRRKWIANDCFFKTELYEGDKSEALYENVFVSLCENKKINDCIFFLNLRDHPVLHKDLKDSYTSIKDEKLDAKYIFDKYCPILSVGCCKDNLDIPMITQDDWSRVSKKYYPDDCLNGYINDYDLIPWELKINKAQFRGSATGCGTDEETNIRIKATILSEKYPDILDAGIIKFNRKLKKSLNKPLMIIDNKKYKTKDFMSLEEKMKYKYILNLDGHVSAYRLGHELSLNSVVLIPDSKYYLWFSKLLIPYVHYIPVKHNLDDLIDQLNWCINNDSKCKEIAINSRLFFDTYLSKDGQLNYMQNVLNSLTFNTLGFKKYSMKIAIITMYKDDINHTRLEQKRYFLYWMNKMLGQICDYDIIVVEQKDEAKFNIGKLKNIGFDYLNKQGLKYDNYIFTDIDTIPDSNLIEYFFKTTDGINALATYGTRYETSGNNIFLGACFSCKNEIFEKLNGFMNSAWQWASEDTNLLMRVYDTKTKFYRNKTGKIIDTEEINNEKKSLLIKTTENKNKRETQEYEKNFNYKNYVRDGLNTLEYEILETATYKNNIHIIVDLKYDNSLKKQPYLYNFDIAIDKETYKKIKRETIYKIKIHEF
jgi:hypothetical protein